MHVHVLKVGFDSTVYVQNTLINMYAVCGKMGDARRLFDERPILLDRFNHIREQEIGNLLKSLLKSSGEGQECNLAAELTTLTNMIGRQAEGERD
jgi:pentatricopeptide repeat protein